MSKAIKTIRVLHASDLHDNHELLWKALAADVDLVILTGDCLPELLRPGQRIGKHNLQPEFQNRWLFQEGERFAKLLAGKPLLVVLGNHDYVSYAENLAPFGVRVFELTKNRPIAELFGIRFGGFREIPFIGVGFPGEIDGFADVYDRVFKGNHKIDVLITHTPPYGILDSGFGAPGLRSKIREAGVQYHLFGHVHHEGGKHKIIDGTNFHNGATCASIIDLCIFSEEG